MKEEHINEIKAIIVLAIGMIIFASLISFTPEDLPFYTSSPNIPTQNLIRVTGAYLASSLLFVFGYSSYVLVLYLFFWSWNKFTSRDIVFSVPKFISFIVLFCVVSAWLGMTSSQDAVIRFEKAGLVGSLLSEFLISYIGRMGAHIVLLTLGVLSLILTGEFLVTPLFLRIVEGFQGFYAGIKLRMLSNETRLPAVNIKSIFEKKFKKKIDKEAPAYVGQKGLDEDEGYEDIYEDEEDQEKPKGKKNKAPKIKIAPNQTNKSNSSEDEIEKIVGEYRIPSIDLLDDSPVVSSSKIESGLKSGAKLLEETLAQFGVDARVADIERGPAITRYELEPAPGVKVNQFTTLSDDIALAMKATAVRIVAPIPGKNRVGIEVPNDSSATVFLKDVMCSDEFRSSKSKLTLALGKDIAGKPMIADLAEMPHLLIAGTTGSGKTVCVNGIIMSMILNVTPDEVKFVMVDPKMVEMAQYNDIPHLLCPTVTDSKKAANVLNWVVLEMETRYKQLSKAGVRNIKGFNEQGNKMPYIVVIIDELADLMQVSAKTVESSITRIAQLSRAVGIHLILATQRPSVDVITGVIKANFPARISFKVASKIDSRTVLDANGAECLLGKGDMLFIQPGDSKPTRGQGNYVNDKEINRVIQFIKDQQAPNYDESIIHLQKTSGAGGTENQDEYYNEAVKLVIETNQASVSILQRRMRLGYTRAARLIDMMEQSGIVGPYCGSKPRDILVDREQWLLENMNDDK
ncbi:MAG: hypothetical protein A2Y03_09280 [Omnitrophica WOR_2 bacterium GWF2_38_59]|nr:MAG: hypothetical protein A2Y06_02110 [Omnitrophica WOR_2 bacterium GWA2_37_7]OGX24765.1 MAG: hypothetical protein A2Y03_09280 [Omnitrophica WOR_2 bacterium GWF2_38_59]OGX51101.1 MAG: hypothetical protein A2243_08130 [Omnitrophica WOR_2 bacterium RIFOXYA2_FULL_38_17]OGX56139.1 MAG: hypothetical protein A2447_07720 [Omnitrophica WOR_2 bacterium RIFOXYC2_FULL_38_12]HBG60902.1 cell division protein FtsK [Candidatus Omnitrophota bacterium]